ncbi:hypothetical protein G6011_03787 [Alternaria panax]|uniref:Uncharacterized protein n=1 Tax=Alternaria panax TaxID=48097 RepID=A0AAD4IFB2_9PLEO|nr:hypothetical protein G6011_03787 [Alternaria panax]
MAPLQRRTANLSLQGTVAVIVLVILFLSGVFCTIIFFKICSKQRRRERAMRRMQEERMPFVGAQYMAPAAAPSDGSAPPYAGEGSLPTELQNKQHYEYTGLSELQNDQQNTGPLELQGGGRPEPLPAQQLDGYTAAPTFDDSKPIELPANAMVNDANGNAQIQNGKAKRDI